MISPHVGSHVPFVVKSDTVNRLVLYKFFAMVGLWLVHDQGQLRRNNVDHPACISVRIY